MVKNTLYPNCDTSTKYPRPKLLSFMDSKKKKKPITTSSDSVKTALYEALSVLKKPLMVTTSTDRLVNTTNAAVLLTKVCQELEGDIEKVVVALNETRDEVSMIHDFVFVVL
jgi:hypothetical protein